MLSPLIIYSLSDTENKKVFIHSLLAGILSNSLMLYWFYNVMTNNGVNIPAAILAMLIFFTYCGFYWAGFSLFCRSQKGSNNFVLIFAIPSAWVALEYIKSYLFTGFPWLLAGYSLYKYPLLLKISSYTGIYGLSFFVLLINTSIVLSIKNRRSMLLIPALLLMSLSSLLYFFKNNDINPDHTEAVRLSLLQGNISQYKKFDDEFTQEILAAYTKLHDRALQSSPDLIIWPETAMPDPLNTSLWLQEYMLRHSYNSNAVEITGSPEAIRGKYFNSVFMISPDGSISSPYRKMHLTPFGEYFPMRNFLSLFTDIVNDLGDFDPGGKIVLMETDKGLKIATPICFESIFPYKTRQFIKNGANLLAVLTNDGWFLDSAGTYQHFIHSVVRASETGRYLVRCANTGISAVISPSGKILKKSPVLKEFLLNSTVHPVNKMTFYSKTGDILPYICIILCFFCIIIKSRRPS